MEHSEQNLKLRLPNEHVEPGNEKNRFACSEGVYAPGIICIDVTGHVTYDPKAHGPSMITRIRNTLGHVEVNFESLLQELISTGVTLKGAVEAIDFLKK